jgi:hypothetical protein
MRASTRRFPPPREPAQAARCRSSDPSACPASSSARRSRRSAGSEARHAGPPQAGPGTRTKWSAADTIAEWADYARRYTKRSNQVQRSFEDTSLKQRGLELVMAA